MTSILDCIERVPSVLEQILEQQEASYAGLAAYLGNRIGTCSEIVLVGSGTSYTAAMTSQFFVEKATGYPVKVVFPNDYVACGRLVNPNAIYIFTSQTGTSLVTCQAMEILTGKGALCVSMTESPDTKLAAISPCHIPLNCGIEEFGMRTIGYTASVLNHMLLGMRLGILNGHLSAAQYEIWQKEAAAVPDSLRNTIEKTLQWFPKCKRQLMRATGIFFTGSGALYGLALEGAVKFWEMPQIISAGYELEEGMHGPNYGYDGRQCLVVLDDGGIESDKAHRLMRYMKEVLHNGIYVGPQPLEDNDLMLQPVNGEFSCLEFSAVVQIMAYRLAVDSGRDISKPLDHSDMYQYFVTHS